MLNKIIEKSIEKSIYHMFEMTICNLAYIIESITDNALVLADFADQTDSVEEADEAAEAATFYAGLVTNISPIFSGAADSVKNDVLDATNAAKRALESAENVRHSN